jgi:hypothetical protein
MTIRLRAIGWFLALSAIMLRAALPIGWMPVADAASGPALVICTGHGPLTTPDHSRKQSPLSGHTNEVCPFAAVTHLSPPADIALLSTPNRDARRVDRKAFGETVVPAEPRHSNHAPRAPPSLA